MIVSTGNVPNQNKKKWHLFIIIIACYCHIMALAANGSYVEYILLHMKCVIEVFEDIISQ
jgi:hypothetical protein